MFDLDNTLVTFKSKNDYTSVEPIKKILIFEIFKKFQPHGTARRMKTHKSNHGKVLADR